MKAKILISIIMTASKGTQIIIKIISNKRVCRIRSHELRALAIGLAVCFPIDALLCATIAGYKYRDPVFRNVFHIGQQ